jgi:intermediate peptidase
MMENLFHEFGHAMHSMFAHTRYQHVSGTRCSTDFAEVPSQLMEYYCREPKILKMFAKHYETNEPMSDTLIHKLCESKKMFSSCELQTQVVNSMLDQAFHTQDLDQRQTTDFIKNYTQKYHSLPYVSDTHWHLRFTHLVGYGAKYYSYLVSKAIASNIWHECFARDPLNSSAGQNYRSKLLEFGGERRPQELLDSLMGFSLDNRSLVKSITKNN